MDNLIQEYISIDPAICRGKPCFRINGKPSRIMIYLVLELLEDAASYDDVFRHYPNLTREHIRAALHYAAQITKSLDYVAYGQP